MDSTTEPTTNGKSKKKTNGASAPEVPAVIMIPLAHTYESKTNPRKTFTAIEELAEDIKVHGVLEPVLVRPRPTGHVGDVEYELVFGARRFRAAKLAGLTHILAMVRDLTDAEALEIQLVENNKRADIHPLEEADGYRQLHEKFGYSVEDLAAKVGKSAAFIYGRLKLCALCGKAREALFAEKITPAVALLLARIPSPELQEQALKDVGPSQHEDAMSAASAARHIQEQFMLRLAEAPFDITDPSLVVAAGACSTCPKRTGNQRELFSDVKSADLCTDPKCFASKRDAAWAIRARAAAEAGQKVIEGNDAKKLFPYGNDRLGYDSGYVDLGGKVWDDGGRREKSVKSILGKNALPPVLARDPSGGIRELVPKAAVDKALRQGEPERPGTSRSEQERARERKSKRMRAAQAAALELIVERASTTKPDDAWFLQLAIALANEASHDTTKAVLARRGLEPGNADGRSRLIKAANEGKPGDVRGLIVELVAHSMIGSWSSEYGKTLLAFAKLYRVDIAKLEAEIRAEEKAKKKRKPVPRAAAAAPRAAKRAKVEKAVQAKVSKKKTGTKKK